RFERAVAATAEPAGGRLCPTRIEVVEHHGSARLRETARDAETDAAAGAGDHGDLIGEVEELNDGLLGHGESSLRIRDVVARRDVHVDHLGRLLEDASAMRRAGGDAIGVAGREDALLPSDDHGERPLHHDAELLDVVLMRLDDDLWVKIELDE